MPRNLNIKFPLEYSEKTNDLFSYDIISSNSIKSKLILFLTTTKGERYFFPDYGSNIKNFIFDKNDDITRDELENDIKNSISRYFRNITIKKFDITTENTTIIMSITFEYKQNSLNFIDDITLRFN